MGEEYERVVGRCKMKAKSFGVSMSAQWQISVCRNHVPSYLRVKEDIFSIAALVIRRFLMI